MPARELRALLRQLFGLQAALDVPTARLDSLPGWDSLRHVELLLACEAHWRIRFLAAEIDRLGSIGDLEAAIAAACARAAGVALTVRRTGDDSDA